MDPPCQRCLLHALCIRRPWRRRMLLLVLIPTLSSTTPCRSIQTGADAFSAPGRVFRYSLHPFDTTLGVTHTSSNAVPSPQQHNDGDDADMNGDESPNPNKWKMSQTDDDQSHEMESYEWEWRSILDPLVQQDEGGTGGSGRSSSAATASVAAASVTRSMTTPAKNVDAVTTSDFQILASLGTSLALGIAFLLHSSGPGAWRYYLAGGVCAAVSHAIPVPIDVAKTRKQVDPAYCHLSMPAALKRLVQTQGVGSLFTGLGPTVWGYFFEGAVKFGVYEILKPWLGMIFPNRWTSFVACATLSGCAAAVLLCPMEALRIRLVAEQEYAAQGWVRGGLRMIHREGMGGLFRGLTPMLYKQVPYTISKNVSFDFLTKFMYTHTSLKMGIPLIAAAVASVLSCLSSQPGDMLLSLVTAHEGERRRTRDVVRQIYHSDRGLSGFMVGVKTRFLHVGVIVTTQLLIYDFVKRLFGIAATGSV